MTEPTTPDPRAEREETRAALVDPEYLAAFEAVMAGGADTLTPDQAAAVARARVLTGTPAPGLPVPVHLRP